MALGQYERYKVWSAIRTFEQFSIPELFVLCNQVPEAIRLSDLDYKEFKKYVWYLRKCGYVDWQEGDKDHTKFRLIRDTGALAPERTEAGFKDHNIGFVSDVSQRIWNVMRLLNCWDLSGLADQAQVPYGTASRYTRLLVAAEYAKCLPRDTQVVGSRNQFNLTRVTGAIAPLFLKDGSVFDCNEFLKELWALKKKKFRRKA